MRFIAFPILLCAVVAPCIVQAAPLERGVAVTDPLALRELDAGRFGLDRMLEPSSAAAAPLTGDRLFALPPMEPVRKAIDGEFDRYIARHKANLATETIGVGSSHAFQLFDRDALYSTQSRFVLAGIVNRMDRAYVSPRTCGEIRLIYRLTGIARAETEGATSPRLPMTLNVVLRARGEKAAASDGVTTCGELARRWLATAEWPQTGADLAKKLTAADGPLEFVGPADVDRIETNLQIAHAPKSAVRDFRTDYLLKLFRYNPQSRTFEEGPLENQIDRDRVLADDNLKREFRTWLLDPRHVGEFDRGTILIPEKFLARSAIASTPVGFAPSNLQPAFGLVQTDKTDAVFTENDVVTALKNASDSGTTLQNIRSIAGFERRLNDITCSGCHQTRGIGGFHFPGADWMAAKPSNSTVVPASLHFFGDQIRRRDILTSISKGAPPDYSRGFSDRPQLRGSTELAGTEYDDGWGAHCYQQKPKAADNDKSFRSWTCAEALACQPVVNATRIGMCFVKSR